MVGEHRRISLLNIGERSIAAERLVTELTMVLRHRGWAAASARDGQGPTSIPQALQQFCDRRVGMSYIPPGTPWNNGTSNRSTTDYARSASTAPTGTHPARGPRGHRRLQGQAQPPAQPRGPWLPNTGRVLPSARAPLPRMACGINQI